MTQAAAKKLKRARPAKADPAAPKARLRRCIVTGTPAAPEGMIRFVVSPQGEITPDLEGKLPGRGLWLTATRAMAEAALKRRAFAKAAKRQVDVAPDFAERLEGLLRTRALA